MDVLAFALLPALPLEFIFFSFLILCQGGPDRSAILSTERQAIKPSPIELNQFP